MSTEAKLRVSNFIAGALGHANATADHSIRLGLLLKRGEDTPTRMVAYDAASKTEFYVDFTLTQRVATPPALAVQPAGFPAQNLEVEIPPTDGRGGW